MAETIGARSSTIAIKGINPAYIVERKINGSDIKPGHFVTNYGESNQSDVDLCEAGEPPLGVALEHNLDDGLGGTIRDTPDIDTLYTDNATVRIALCGSGIVCLVFAAGQTTTTAIYGGSRVTTAASGTCGLPTFATSTAELHADWLGACGKSIEYDTGGSLVRVIAVCI